MDGQWARQYKTDEEGETLLDEEGNPVVDQEKLNRYQYNGKERTTDLGLNWNDYGARYYDPAIRRWMSTDNHAESYVQYSPYNYVINNPINVIDPDGNDIFILTWFTSKGHVGHAGIAIENYKTVNKKDANGNVHTEGRAADGIVQIGTTFAQDEAAKNYASNEVKNQTKYNACANNCSTFVQNTANKAISGNINAFQTLTPNFALRMIGYKKINVVAPNNLYNAALKVKGATRAKGPAKADDSKSYLDLYKGN